MPVRLSDQASRRPDTLTEEIVEVVASLVLARSPFGYGHEPCGGAASGNEVLFAVGAVEPVLLQAAVSRVNAAAAAHQAIRRVDPALIASPPIEKSDISIVRALDCENQCSGRGGIRSWQRPGLSPATWWA
ncbi:hypothetical protein GCM10028798_07130 [Humibacter antri]